MARRVRKRIAQRPPPKPREAQRSRRQAPYLPVLSLDRSSNNLPIQLTSFIGRDREIAEITQALSHTRLLTLTGSGGCGKTRLALQVAGGLVGSYADGIWLVELASLRRLTLVPKAIASALGIPEHPGRPVSETLRRYLQTKSLLLVLDNCEHLLPACAQQAEALLRVCPALRILATSREGLGIAGELAHYVPGLSLPDTRNRLNLEGLRQFEAVRLFVERASFSQPGFVVTERNAPAVAQVCSSLDGIPLAIELAAARVRGLSVEQIASLLGDQFHLLTEGRRSAVPRHQTLQATMDWSYGLLTEPERVVLRRASIFAGGFALEAAEEVCGGEAGDTSAILDLLLRLVDRSLVVSRDRGNQSWYRLLETVRQYAWRKLLESGEVDVMRQRHLTYYLGLADQAEAKLRGPQQQIWLDLLETEHDNFREALEHCNTDPSRAGAGLRLATALSEFWSLRGHWGEERRWFEAMISLAGKASSHVPTKSLRSAAMIAWQQGDYERATALARKGLTSARSSGDRENVVYCRIILGHIAVHQGDYEQAARLLESSVNLCRKLNDSWQLGWALCNLGFVARDQGDYGRAMDLTSAGLALFQKTGDKHYVAWALRNLGLVALRQGDHKQAAVFCRESLTLTKEIGGVWQVEQGLFGLGGAAALKGQHEQAARLFAAAEALRKSLGRQRSIVDQADFDKRIATTRTGLGVAAFAAAWSQGTTMLLEDAIEAALATTESLPTDKQVKFFTPREREVMALVAQGLTNREIASRLVISERTADTHVQHLLNKLGVRSRVQVTAWAVERGLHTE